MKINANMLTSMHRTVDVHTRYLEYIQHKLETSDTSCDICKLVDNNPINIAYTDKKSKKTHDTKTLAHVCVIQNEFPYSIYDGRYVKTHHMLAPIKHYATSSELPREVKEELRDTQDTLLDSGVYDGSFVRSTYSPTSSVPGHLHIHLVKLGPKVVKQDFDGRIGKNDIEYEDLPPNE